MTNDQSRDKPRKVSAWNGDGMKRRDLLLSATSLVAASALTTTGLSTTAQAQQPAPAQPSGRRPNILVIFGGDVGVANISAYSNGLMGYETPNIDRIGREGIKFLHYYGEQSCTAGRAAFLTGQHGIRTGLTKVGFPGAPMGMSQSDPSIGGLLKNLGYATGQFGKNHVGDRNESLPTVNGFDEFFGNLYHLNAEEEPELPDYPKDPTYLAKFGPRGVLKCKATDRDDPTVDPRFGDAAPAEDLQPVPGSVRTGRHHLQHVLGLEPQPRRKRVRDDGASLRVRRDLQGVSATFVPAEL
jgi:arylsulfatase A-like enzyme